MNRRMLESLFENQSHDQKVKSARKKLIPLFFVTIFIGGIFTAGFVGSWVGFCFFNGNSGCAAVCTLFGIFCMPLFFGSIQALRGRPSGLRLLKFGSLMFIVEPGYLIDIWTLGASPEYQFYLAWLECRSQSRDSVG